MSLTPTLFALFTAMQFFIASGRLVQDSGLLMSQQAARLLALQRAEVKLAHAARRLADPHIDIDAAAAIQVWSDDDGDGSIETLPVAADAELEELPLTLQRVTVVGQQGGTRIRLQADFAVDGCESAHDDPCAPRVRRIAWRQLSPD